MVERIAQAKAHKAFAECGADERERLLREFQRDGDADSFQMIADFTYEAYYGHHDVLESLEATTGWKGLGPMKGGPMKPFDPSLLARVKALPPRWRKV
jgi:hypothetical protein